MLHVNGGAFLPALAISSEKIMCGTYVAYYSRSLQATFVMAPFIGVVSAPAPLSTF